MRYVLMPFRLLAVCIWVAGTALVSISVLIAATCGNIERYVWKS